MLDSYKLFDLIQDSDYTKSGMDVDWTIKTIDDTIYLLFHGSNSDLDYKVALDFPIRPYKHQKNKLWLHRGFSKAWKSCNDMVMKCLIQAVNNNPDKEVVIAGHSYGGSMSEFAAEDFNYRTGRKVHLFTYGSADIMAPIAPKTKKRFEECLLSYHLYVYRCDLIPLLPPFYSNLKKTKLGKFSIRGIFKKDPIAHLSYGDPSLYRS